MKRHKKIMPCLICLCLLTPFGAVKAQHNTISIHVEDVNLEQFFSVIESQTNYKFSYRNMILDTKRDISLDRDHTTVESALNHVLPSKGLEFRITSEKSIVITRAAVATPSTATAQVKTISGYIVDEKGEPIIGANIVIEGTGQGTITDFEGRFTLDIPAHASLAVSYIGYLPERIKTDGRNVYNITLREDTKTLDEVVVVGYGVQKKVNLTGAVAAVKGAELESRPIVSVGSGLQGLLSGVTVTQSSGQPGADNISIVIRGTNTINSSTQPLVLIDGVAGGDLNLLNPDDIDNISVLKDAASAAIYGARAANGVILVTTKKGVQKESTTVSYSGYVGMQTPNDLPELVNGWEYMELANEAYIAAGFGKLYQDEAFEAYLRGDSPNEYSNTDWIKEVYKRYAFQTGHNINVRGGTAKSGYFMSYGFLQQDGLIVNDPYASRRHNARLSMNTELHEKLKVNGSMSFVDFYRKENGLSGTSGVFRTAQRMSPLLPVKWQEQDENGRWTDTEHYSFTSFSNPVDVASNAGYNKRNSRTFDAQINASFEVIKGLFLNAQYALNYFNRDDNRYTARMLRYMSDGTEDPGNESRKNYISRSHLHAMTQTLNATANYQKKIARHDVNLLAGFSQEWSETQDIGASRKSILVEDLKELSMGTEELTNNGSTTDWALRSYFGRVNYNFAEKYLFEANLRIDGTSRFHKDHRWGYFPSFSGGWRFSEESFMDFAEPIMQSGKLRVSWGELGNQNIGSDYYPFLTVIETEDKSYPIGNKENVGFRQMKLGNSKIKWETVRIFNIGLDFTLFDNRLDITADWFKKNNLNALVRTVLPVSVGFFLTDDFPMVNLGEIENKGWELNLAWRDQVGGVKYSAVFNLSDAKNKILDLGGTPASIGDNLRREGDPVNAYFGYKTNGLAQIDDFEGVNEFGNYINPDFPVFIGDANVQPGDIKYADLSGPDGAPDGIIDDYDKVVIGNKSPRYCYSLRADVEWKGIDLSFFLQGVGKADGYLSEEARHAFINDYSVPKKTHLDRWTPDNTAASYPRLYYAQTHNRRFSDYWIDDASYLRLKNVQLGYTFPQKMTKKFGVNRLRCYVSADNLFTITKFTKGFDPEIQSSTQMAGDVYPQVKTYVFGLNVVF